MDHARSSPWWAYSRGVLGAVVMACSLGIARALGDVGAHMGGLDGPTHQLLQAILCSTIAVALIRVLRCRIDRRSWAGLGLPPARESLRTFALGIIVSSGAAALLFGIATVRAWIRWRPLDLPSLIGFLLTTAPIALLYEALPEELTLRGYSYTSLNTRLRWWTAMTTSTLLFLTVPGLSNGVYALLSWTFGGTPPPVTLVPQGEDPVAYLILLTLFGMTLTLARTTTGSLWTGIGLHLMFLLINRVVVFGDQRGAGWSAEFLTPDALLLIPGYLGVVALAFVVRARLHGRHRGRRQGDPVGAHGGDGDVQHHATTERPTGP